MRYIRFRMNPGVDRGCVVEEIAKSVLLRSGGPAGALLTSPNNRFHITIHLIKRPVRIVPV
jgi:hypothetical protein